jgi:hypothetical protein
MVKSKGVNIEKNKKIDATKKLQNLVKTRKTPVVITKQGSIKNRKSSSGESVESYCYTSYNN